MAFLSRALGAKTVNAQNVFITGRNKWQFINMFATFRTVYINIIHLSWTAVIIAETATRRVGSFFLPKRAIAIVTKNFAIA
jgi:hypothetical protein